MKDDHCQVDNRRRKTCGPRALGQRFCSVHGPAFESRKLIVLEQERRERGRLEEAAQHRRGGPMDSLAPITFSFTKKERTAMERSFLRLIGKKEE